MHAVVVEVEILDADAARQGLVDVVAMTKQAPGLVAGYWVRVGDNRGTSVVVFETEAQANAAKPPSGADAHGVRMTSVSVGEVLASV